MRKRPLVWAALAAVVPRLAVGIAHSASSLRSERPSLASNDGDDVVMEVSPDGSTNDYNSDDGSDRDTDSTPSAEERSSFVETEAHASAAAAAEGRGRHQHEHEHGHQEKHKVKQGQKHLPFAQSFPDAQLEFRSQRLANFEALEAADKRKHEAERARYSRKRQREKRERSAERKGSAAAEYGNNNAKGKGVGSGGNTTTVEEDKDPDLPEISQSGKLGRLLKWEQNSDALLESEGEGTAGGNEGGNGQFLPSPWDPLPDMLSGKDDYEKWKAYRQSQLAAQKAHFRPYNLERAAKPWSGRVSLRDPTDKTGERKLSLCRGAISSWRLFDATVEAQESLGDDELEGVLSFGANCEIDSRASADWHQRVREWKSAKVRAQRIEAKTISAVGGSGLDESPIMAEEGQLAGGAGGGAFSLVDSAPQWTLVPVNYPTESGEYWFRLEYNNTGLYIGQSSCEMSFADQAAGGSVNAKNSLLKNLVLVDKENAAKEKVIALRKAEKEEQERQNKEKGEDGENDEDKDAKKEDEETAGLKNVKKVPVADANAAMPRKACYMAYRGGTTPLLLTRFRPTLFKLMIVGSNVTKEPDKKASFLEDASGLSSAISSAVGSSMGSQGIGNDRGEAQRRGLQLIGVNPRNTLASYQFALDLKLGMVRRDAKNSVLEGQTEAGGQGLQKLLAGVHKGDPKSASHLETVMEEASKAFDTGGGNSGKGNLIDMLYSQTKFSIFSNEADRGGKMAGLETDSEGDADKRGKHDHGTGLILEFTPPLYCEWLFPASECSRIEIGEPELGSQLTAQEGSAEANLRALMRGEWKKDVAFAGLVQIWRDWRIYMETNMVEAVSWFLGSIGFVVLFYLTYQKLHIEVNHELGTEDRVDISTIKGNAWHHQIFKSRDIPFSTTFSSNFNSAINEKVGDDSFSGSHFEKGWAADRAYRKKQMDIAFGVVEKGEDGKEVDIKRKAAPEVQDDDDLDEEEREIVQQEQIRLETEQEVEALGLKTTSAKAVERAKRTLLKDKAFARSDQESFQEELKETITDILTLNWFRGEATDEDGGPKLSTAVLMGITAEMLKKEHEGPYQSQPDAGESSYQPPVSEGEKAKKEGRGAKGRSADGWEQQVDEQRGWEEGWEGAGGEQAEGEWEENQEPA